MRPLPDPWKALKQESIPYQIPGTVPEQECLPTPWQLPRSSNLVLRIAAIMPKSYISDLQGFYNFWRQYLKK